MMTKDGEQLGGEWENAEWRVFEFDGYADDGEKKLVETEQSWKRRGAVGPSQVADGAKEKGEVNQKIEMDKRAETGSA